jgi:hypothetical protein
LATEVSDIGRLAISSPRAVERRLCSDPRNFDWLSVLALASAQIRRSAQEVGLAGDVRDVVNVANHGACSPNGRARRSLE